MSTRPQPGDVVQIPGQKSHAVHHHNQFGKLSYLQTLCGKSMRGCDVCGGDKYKVFHNVSYLRRTEPTCRTCLRIEAKQKGERQ